MGRTTSETVESPSFERTRIQFHGGHAANFAKGGNYRSNLSEETLAEGDALGQQIQIADKDSSETGTNETKTPVEIVGIVPYTPNSLFDRDSNGTLYLPFAGGFQSNVFFHLKFASGAGRDVNATAELIRRTVHEVDGRFRFSV